jgi:hypothetical protein
MATVELRSIFSTRDEVAVVSVEAESNNEVVTGETNVRFVVPARLLISSLRNEMPAQLTENTEIEAIVQDAAGNPIPFYDVHFETNLGRFPDGEDTFTLETDEEGNAQATLYAWTRTTDDAVDVPEQVIVTARAADIREQETLEFYLDPNAPACEEYLQQLIPPIACQGSLDQPFTTCRTSATTREWCRRDIYRIALDGNQTVNVRLKNFPHPEADYDIALYDPTGEQFLAYSNKVGTGANVEEFDYKVPSAGQDVYYIEINSVDPEQKTTPPDTYQLEIELDPLPAPEVATQQEQDTPTLQEHVTISPVLPPKP